MNENTPGFCFSGFLIMMLIPRFMNGLVKSTTRSRSEVIVNGAIAMSASCITTVNNTWMNMYYKTKTAVVLTRAERYACSTLLVVIGDCRTQAVGCRTFMSVVSLLVVYAVYVSIYYDTQLYYITLLHLCTSIILASSRPLTLFSTSVACMLLGIGCPSLVPWPIRIGFPKRRCCAPSCLALATPVKPMTGDCI